MLRDLFSADEKVPADIVATSPVATPMSLPFKQDDAGPTLSWSAGLMLLALAAVAVVAWLRNGHSNTSWRSLLGGFSSGVTRASTPPQDDQIVVESRIRLDQTTQLVAVRWAGRRLLLARTVNSAPVVLERIDAQLDAAARGANDTSTP